MVIFLNVNSKCDGFHRTMACSKESSLITGPKSNAIVGTGVHFCMHVNIYGPRDVVSVINYLLA